MHHSIWCVVHMITFGMMVMACSNVQDTMYAKEDWPTYLGDKGVRHYSLLDQMTKENVGNLQLAWVFDGGEASVDNRSMIQCNPLVIDGILYGTTATLKVIALNAATGERIWTYRTRHQFHRSPRAQSRFGILARWQPSQTLLCIR